MVRMSDAEIRIFAHHLFQGLIYDSGVWIGEQKAKGSYPIPVWVPSEDEYQWIELMWNCMRNANGLQQELFEVYGGNMSHYSLRQYLNVDEERFKKSPHYMLLREGHREVVYR